MKLVECSFLFMDKLCNIRMRNNLHVLHTIFIIYDLYRRKSVKASRESYSKKFHRFIFIVYCSY